MNDSPLKDDIVAGFDSMPPQLRRAARYILDHPQDVALLSMREVARRADVQPATMTRLAKFLGLGGFEDIRLRHAHAIRNQRQGFAGRAAQHVENQAAHGADGLAARMFESLAAQIATLARPGRIAELNRAAELLRGARRIHCFGLRSCHSVSWHFHYVMSLLGERTVHLDGPAGTGTDPLIHARPEDALFVISISPYARQSLDIARAARDMGLRLVAITDSEVSPLAGLADASILVPTESQTFFHAISPAFAVAEVLSGLLAGMEGEAAMAALKRTDTYLQATGTYAGNPPERRPCSPTGNTP